MNPIASYLKAAGKLGVWGVGVEGQSTLRFLHQSGLTEGVEVFDLNPEKASATLAEKGLEGFSVRSQDELVARSQDLDLIVVSPGIPFRKFGLPDSVHIENQISLLLRHYSEKVIGATGTKGKSTFCSLLYKAMKAQGKHCLLIGNIGTPPLDLSDELDTAEWIVGEMSSYQLDPVRHSPRISVVLNLFEDHLDYHGGRAEYWAAKFNIFRHPVGPSLCCYAAGHEDLRLAVEAACSGKLELDAMITGDFAPAVPQEVRDGALANPALSPVHLRGMLNAIWRIAQETGLEPPALVQACGEFQALNFRLQDEGVHRGIRFINDSISTVPECTLAALQAYPECDCLIMGGMDRGVNYKAVAEFLSTWPGHLLLLPDSGNRLQEEIESFAEQPAPASMTKVANLEEAVREAYARCKTVCVFSPGAPSYNSHLNFIDRGKKLSGWIRDLADEAPAS